MNNVPALPFIPREKVAELYTTDDAFKYSIDNDDLGNMAIVLRAHGYNYTFDAIEYAMFFGKNVKEFGYPVARF